MGLPWEAFLMGEGEQRLDLAESPPKEARRSLKTQQRVRPETRTLESWSRPGSTRRIADSRRCRRPELKNLVKSEGRRYVYAAPGAVRT
jgi:hypothetical protein